MIRKMSVDDMQAEPNLAALLDAYADEACIEGMPRYNAQMDYYRNLESVDVLHVFGAFSADELVGFICLLVTMVPHYAAMIATTESFFVAPEHRHTGAGIKLLRAAEEHAATMGAAAMFVSAPKDGKLAAVMDVMPSYRETNRVFFREIAHV